MNANLLIKTTLLLFIIIIQVSGQTREISGNIQGTLYSDTTYYVTGNLVVNSGNLLTIQAGTNLLFEDSIRLEVSGELQAVGTSTDSIIFSRRNTRDRWLGIRLLSASSSSRIEYCRIEYGYARPNLGADGAHYGGGLVVGDCSPTIRHNLIRYCRAVRSGGAIGCFNSAHPLIENNILEYDSTGIGGGAILVLWGSSPTIRGNTMRHNYTTQLGGAIDVNGATTGCFPIIENNIITYNKVSAGSGGAISVKVNNSEPVIRNNFIAYNSAMVHGGGLYFTNTGKGKINNNIIIKNTSNSTGGNTGGGGGIAIYNSNVTFDNIYNNTIADNYCNTTNPLGAGGGLYISGTDTDVGFSSNIIWGNDYNGSNDNYRQIYRSSGTVQIDSSVVQSGISDAGITANNIITSDPGFMDSANDDYSLQAGSPCIDTGSVVYYTNMDYAGFYRWVDGDSSGTSGPDIGAYEFMPAGQIIPQTSQNYYFVVNSDSEAVLNFSSIENSNGQLSVYAYKNRYPHDKGSGKAVKRWYDIRESGIGTFSVNLTLYYSQSEFDDSNISSESSVQFYKNAGDHWFLNGGTANSTLNKVQKSGVTGFSRYTFADPGDSPLPVQLNSFRAVMDKKAVLLEWITSSELNNLGFSVYRSESADGLYILLSDYTVNEGLIGQINSSGGKVYRYFDHDVIENTELFYKLMQTDINGSETEISIVSVHTSSHLPEQFYLGQNYPNPFNYSTVIPYENPVSQYLELILYNSLGQIMATLVADHIEPGFYKFDWDYSELASGIYFYALIGENDFQVRKMILMK